MSRSVLVTGGSRGIGEAIALDLVARGHRVAAIQRGDGVPSGVLGVCADVTDQEQVDAAFTRVEKAHGPVEILVSNAGITEDTLLVTMTEEQFTRVIDVNLSGAYRVARRAAPGMLRNRWGRFIFISSIIGHLGSAGQVNYAASKAGLMGLSRSLAREFGRRNITSNVVTPGYVTTDITDKLDQDLKDRVLRQIPVGRYAEPADVAKVVRFLASEDSAYVNGAVVPVDGGLAMGH